MKLLATLTVAVVLVGCYAPGYQDCEISCASGTCPSGLTCLDRVCRLPNMVGTCGAGSDGGVDTLIDGGGFGPPKLVTPDPALDDQDPTVTDNLLEVFFCRTGDIYRTFRPSITGGWSSPIREASLSSNPAEEGPDVSGNGMTMFFVRDGVSLRDINMATRPAGGLWSAGQPVNGLDPGGNAAGPSVSRDGMIVVFERLEESFSLWTSTRVGAAWPTPTPLTEFPDGPMRPHSPMLSTDKLTIYFHANPTGSNSDIYEAHRTAIGNRFGAPMPVAGINTPANEEDPWVSDDGRVIFFASTMGGGRRIWEASR